VDKKQIKNQGPEAIVYLFLYPGPWF